MIVLAIHTAGPACQLALIKDAKTVKSINHDMPRGHDVHLATMTVRVMEEAGLAFSNIDRIGVCVGPGSFTGIRIGLAFARGLSLALDKPALGLTHLQCILPDLAPEQAVLAISAAKRRPPEISFWAQNFIGNNPVDQAFELGHEDIRQLYLNTDIMLCADTATQDLLDKHLRNSMTFVQAIEYPAIRLGRLAEHYDPQSFLPEPVYVRPPDARSKV